MPQLPANWNPTGGGSAGLGGSLGGGNFQYNGQNQNIVEAAVNAIPAKGTATVVATAPQAGTYNQPNGSSVGVGATFTYSAVGTTVIDSHTLVVNEYVLLAAQAAPAQNGLFQVTTAGTTGVATVLTRVPALNSSADFPGALVVAGGAGSVYKGSSWICTATGTPVMGTDPLVFVQAPIAKRTTSVNAPASPLSLNTDTFDIYKITGLANTLTINITGGSPKDRDTFTIYITDNGTAQVLIFGTSFAVAQAVVTMPVVTLPGQKMTLDFIYDADIGKWKLYRADGLPIVTGTGAIQEGAETIIELFDSFAVTATGPPVKAASGQLYAAAYTAAGGQLTISGSVLQPTALTATTYGWINTAVASNITYMEADFAWGAAGSTMGQNLILGLSTAAFSGSSNSIVNSPVSVFFFDTGYAVYYCTGGTWNNIQTVIYPAAMGAGTAQHVEIAVDLAINTVYVRDPTGMVTAIKNSHITGNANYAALGAYTGATTDHAVQITRWAASSAALANQTTMYYRGQALKQLGRAIAANPLLNSAFSSAGQVGPTVIGTSWAFYSPAATVTVDIGPSGKAIILTNLYGFGASSTQISVGAKPSGANTAGGPYAQGTIQSSGANMWATGFQLVSGLNPGLTTFTNWFVQSGNGSCTIWGNNLMVIPL